VLRSLRILSLACAITLTAGCSANADRSPAAQQQPSSLATSASPKPSIRALPPVAKVTAACTLLSSDELKVLLGGTNSQTEVSAVEDKPDLTHNSRTYGCEYGSGGKYPFSLGIQTFGVASFTPKDAIDAVAQASKVKTHKVAGVGDAGVFYSRKDGISLLAVSKWSHGETRTVYFSAPVAVPEANFINVGRLVISRI
jgi:hypothetical protein